MKLETIISCRTDIYFDYQLIDVATEKILVDRVYDKAYEKSNKEEWEEYYQFEQYKSFAAQFWGRYNFARENTAMRNEYDFSSAKRNPYTT